MEFRRRVPLELRAGDRVEEPLPRSAPDAPTAHPDQGRRPRAVPCSAAGCCSVAAATARSCQRWPHWWVRWHWQGHGHHGRVLALAVALVLASAALAHDGIVVRAVDIGAGLGDDSNDDGFVAVGAGATCGGNVWVFFWPGLGRWGLLWPTGRPPAKSYERLRFMEQFLTCS